MGYIYKITNLINNKVYIGQTGQALDARWNDHKKSFKQLCDEMVIHKAMFKYGESNFSFEMLEAARWVEYLKSDGVIITNTQQVNPMPVIIGKGNCAQLLARS